MTDGGGLSDLELFFLMLDMTKREIFEEVEAPRVLGRWSWFGDPAELLEDVGDVAVSAELGSASAVLLGESVGFGRLLLGDCCCDFAVEVAVCEASWKLCRSGFAFEFSEGRARTKGRMLSLSRAWAAWKSEDCLPLTGVTGSLREATVSASSSLSSWMAVVSSVGNCGGDEEALE